MEKEKKSLSDSIVLTQKNFITSPTPTIYQIKSINIKVKVKKMYVRGDILKFYIYKYYLLFGAKISFWNTTVVLLFYMLISFLSCYVLNKYWNKKINECIV